MGVGFITTTDGRGCREAGTTGSAVGGGRRKMFSMSRLVMTFVGIRYLTIKGILIRGVTGIRIDGRVIPVVVVE
jgi:hypothetical protein